MSVQAISAPESANTLPDYPYRYQPRPITGDLLAAAYRRPVWATDTLDSGDGPGWMARVGSGALRRPDVTSVEPPEVMIDLTQHTSIDTREQTIRTGTVTMSLTVRDPNWTDEDAAQTIEHLELDQAVRLAIGILDAVGSVVGTDVLVGQGVISRAVHNASDALVMYRDRLTSTSDLLGGSAESGR